MKFLGKSCENFKKLGIKNKQEKIWDNFEEFLKQFQSASFIENTAFLYEIRLSTELITSFLVPKSGNTDRRKCVNMVFTIIEKIFIIYKY